MPPGVAGRRTAPTSIPEPKVLYPTMEQFSDFMGYIKSIEDSGDSRAGICKIVPPKEWVPRKAGYDLNDMNYTIQGPIKQNFKNFVTALFCSLGRNICQQHYVSTWKNMD